MTADPPTSTSKVSVEWVEDDLFVGSDEEGHSVVFDSSLRTKPGKGIGPMKALLASLGACSGMDVAAILLKRRQKLESLSVELSGKRPQYGHPKPFTEIHLRFLVGGQVDERYVKEAVTESVTKFCSVAATVNGKAKITYDYQIKA
ncbi:MAG TPA: OsmC family protein [Nitrososphaerales archaeon]|nr:OsmC family protein [Nitrososphaerales archaeon]